MLKAFLIDPEAKKITAIELPAKEEERSDIIGGITRRMEAEFEWVDTITINDEGDWLECFCPVNAGDNREDLEDFFSDQPDIFLFRWDGQNFDIPGKGVVYREESCDDAEIGDFIGRDPSISEKEVRRKVAFIGSMKRSEVINQIVKERLKLVSKWDEDDYETDVLDDTDFESEKLWTSINYLRDAFKPKHGIAPRDSSLVKLKWGPKVEVLRRFAEYEGNPLALILLGVACDHGLAGYEEYKKADYYYERAREIWAQAGGST